MRVSRKQAAAVRLRYQPAQVQPQPRRRVMRSRTCCCCAGLSLSKKKGSGCNHLRALAAQRRRYFFNQGLGFGLVEGGSGHQRLHLGARVGGLAYQRGALLT